MRRSGLRPSGLWLLGGLLAYGLLQPTLNARMGWHLPSLAAVLGQTQSGSPTVESSKNTPAKPVDGDIASASPDGLLYGLLRESRPHSQDFVSPAGLRYQKGSEEGHRLSHLERHLKDQPTRPGKHGVFFGEMPQVLRWIDEAYERGMRGGQGVSQRREDGRITYEVAFDLPIGFIGGRDGKRDGNPDARRLRLIVDGNRFITAFPY